MTKCIIEDCQVCLDRAFTMNVLTKIGFQQNFSNRINLLLNSRELCVINRGKLHNIFFEKEECDKAAQPKTNLFILFWVSIIVIFLLVMQMRPCFFLKNSRLYLVPCWNIQSIFCLLRTETSSLLKYPINFLPFEN